jgi:hypothetical protein
LDAHSESRVHGAPEPPLQAAKIVLQCNTMSLEDWGDMGGRLRPGQASCQRRFAMQQKLRLMCRVVTR